MFHKVFNPLIKISKLGENRISISFTYNPDYVRKIKNIPGHRWHPDGKYWSLPHTNSTLEKILRVFKGQEVNLAPALQNVFVRSTSFLLSTGSATEQSHTENCHSELVSESPTLRITHHDFEYLWRELLSRKYSYKTVKVYIYYNKDLVNFTGKIPSDINDNDIKNYLIYLVEDKQSATSHLIRQSTH